MLYIKIDWSGYPEAKISHLRRGTKRGLEKAVLHWHRTYAKRHFWPSAKARYNYKDRSAAYERRKRRRFGHNKPLVWSGKSRDQILSHIRVTTTVTREKRRAKGSLTAPRYFWMTRAGHPNKGNEALRVIPEEKSKLHQIVVAEIEKELKRANRKRRVEVIR